MNPLSLDQAGEDLIKGFERLVLTPYFDEHGIPTIGWGHTKGVTMRTPEITEAKAEQFFIDDIAEACRAVNNDVLIDLSQNEFNALVSLCFNIGATEFSGSTLVRKINVGDKDGAAAQFDRWIYVRSPGLRFSQGLIIRREKEKKLFLGKALASTCT